MAKTNLFTDVMEMNPLMTEITQPQKFLFNLSFDDEVGCPLGEREKPKPTYSQEQIDEARKESYESGFNAGQKAMMEDQQQRMNVLLAQIDQHVGHLAQSSQEEWQTQLGQLQQIALVIARKIMPTYVQRYGVEEIETIVDRIVAEMSREPRLVIRVSENQFDEVSAKINEITANQAYAGKVVILGDADLGESDCRVEWADGGIERDLRMIWEDIDRVMSEIQSAPLEEKAPEPVAAAQPAEPDPAPEPEPEAPKEEPPAPPQEAQQENVETKLVEQAAPVGAEPTTGEQT